MTSKRGADAVNEIVKYLTKYVDYVDYVDVVEARIRMYSAGHIIDDDIPTFIMFANYIGTLKRIAYYKYVHKGGIDVRYLADACVKAFMFNDVYRFEFTPYLRRREFKKVIDATPYPKWTRLGLIGGSTNDLANLGEEFCKNIEEAIN